MAYHVCQLFKPGRCKVFHEKRFQGFHLFVFRGVSYHGIVKHGYGCNLSHQRNILEKAFAFLYGFGLYLFLIVFYIQIQPPQTIHRTQIKRLQMEVAHIYTLHSLQSGIGYFCFGHIPAFGNTFVTPHLYMVRKMLIPPTDEAWRFYRVNFKRYIEFHSHVHKCLYRLFFDFQAFFTGQFTFIIQLFHLS